jgi:hypothetical protein
MKFTIFFTVTVNLCFGFSIKQITVALSDKSAVKMLKDEWLINYCRGYVIALLRFLDIETYESAMGVLLKEGASDDIFFRHG